jgi:spore germination cell wall hydrolase CwlJ-like protein
MNTPSEKEDTMENIFRMTSYVIGLLVVTMFVQTVTLTKFNTLKAQGLSDAPDVVTIQTRERQLDCMAMNIYREAGHEPFEGKVAVAQVTMNRVADGRFGNDVCGVIYKKSVIMDKVVCQFSWACDQAAKTTPVNNAAYRESYEVAKKVLLEGFKLSVLKDALYYHANYVNPQWPLEKIGTIGNHIFYKPKR